MKILVYGAVPDHPNLGVSALAHGASVVLTRAFPGADIRFRATGPEGDGPMNLSHSTPLLREMIVNKRGLRSWTRSFDLVCDIRGGDSFTDIYTSKMLLKLSVFPLYAQAMRVPVVMLPQTIGPFERPSSQALARLFLRRCRLVMARDPQSAAVAASLGRPVDLTATDVVFALGPPAPSDGEHDVLLNVSGLLWHENRHVDHEVYRDAIRMVIDALHRDARRVTLLAHVVGTGTVGRDNDRAALESLRQTYDSSVDYVIPTDLHHLRSVMSTSQVVVGARMHACLNALSLGVPAIPMAYSRKFSPLLQELGWHHTVSVRGTASDVARQVLAEVQAASAEEAARVRSRAVTKISEVVQLLRDGPSSSR